MYLLYAILKCSLKDKSQVNINMQGTKTFNAIPCDIVYGCWFKATTRVYGNRRLC